MANKSLFKSQPGRQLPHADTTNMAGGAAYALRPEYALAQFASTGCLNRTFYASAEDQLDMVIQLARHADPTFVAKVAVHARESGAMKDMPALLCAVLASTDGPVLEKVFDRVIDSGKMLRTFVQVIRSGATGRKSMGSRPKRLVRQWFEKRSDEQVFFASVGNDPSLADVIKMVHPKPANESRRALYAYLIGRPHEPGHLPRIVSEYEAFKVSVAQGN
jgi:60 kDa SS-A/Ro ribonucleoprotein